MFKKLPNMYVRFNVLLLVMLLLVSGVSMWAQSQVEALSAMSDGDYVVYKTDGDDFVSTPKPWGIVFKKNGKSYTEVIVNRLGVIEENFKADLAESPAYFKFEGLRLLAMDGKLFYYEWKQNTASILYVLCSKGSISGDVSDWNKRIAETQKNHLATQSASRQQIKEQQQANDEKDRAEQSLKGKQLSSLKVIVLDGTESNGNGSKIKYGIEAQFANGAVAKTSNLGGKLPWDDVDVKVVGGEFGEEEVIVAQDASSIPQDKVTITAKSKYHSVNASASVNMVYDISHALDFSGNTGGVSGINAYGGSYPGQSGANLLIKVSKATSGSGKAIVKVEISNSSTGKVLHRLKMTPEASLSITSNGGNGSFNSKNGYAGNGGNGGNVKIIQDPSTSAFHILVINKAGMGGQNRDNVLRNGQNGVAGKVENLAQSVQLSW